MTRFIRIQFLILCSMLMFASARATSLFENSRQMISQEVVQESAWIGMVEILDSSLLPTNLPMTEFRARIVDVVKGEGKAGDVFRFVLPGGRKGGKTFSVMGMSAADFRAGHEYMMFFELTPAFNSRSAYAFVNPRMSPNSWTAFQILKTQRGEKTSERIARRAGSLGMVSRSPSGLTYRHADTQMFRLGDLVDEINRAN